MINVVPVCTADSADKPSASFACLPARFIGYIGFLGLAIHSHRIFIIMVMAIE